MTKTPYEFQSTAVELIVESNALINDKCGLGKTLTAIWGLEAFTFSPYREGNGKGPHLVVCLKNSRVQWQREILETLNWIQPFILDTDGSILNRNLDRVGSLQDGGLVPGIIITHYENMVKWGSQLSREQWVTIIADEAHKIKNRKTKRAKWLKLLKAERKIALTATPMEKRPSDYWSVVNWLRPRQFKSFHKFSEQYEKFEPTSQWQPYPVFLGPQNLEDLAREIGPFTLARTKEEVAPELPPKRIQRVPVELTFNQKKLYTQIASAKDIDVPLEMFNEFQIGKGDDFILVKNVLSKIIRLQQVSASPILLGYDIPSAKLEWVDEFIQNNPEEPLVVFTRFRDIALRLSGKYKAPCIVGGIRNPMVEAAPFITGKKDLIIGTIDAMGIAIDGLQRASTAIFIDQTWSTIAMEQAQDRIHRINIKAPKNIVFLYSVKTMDELVLEALDNKWSDRELVAQFLKEWSE